MPGFLMAILFAFVIALVAVVAIVRGTRSYAARVVLAVMLMPAAAFCLFGFAATIEPMDAVEQWSFRIGYLASYFLFTFVSFAVAGVLAAACRNDPDIDAGVSAISIWLAIVLVLFAIPWLGMNGVLSLECFMKQ
ncbi:MAG: hypothetical protein O3C40_13205 [Planctomycetota bacterium]|nr:hypothetical protein [Planctomycetota bacterium]